MLLEGFCSRGGLRKLGVGEVACNHPIHPREDLHKGGVVVFLELTGPRVGDLRVVDLRHIRAGFDYLFGNHFIGTDDEVIVREVHGVDMPLSVVGDVQPNTFGGFYRKLGSTPTFCGVLADADALAGHFVTSVTEIHPKNCRHHGAPVAVADAHTENFYCHPLLLFNFRLSQRDLLPSTIIAPTVIYVNTLKKGPVSTQNGG